MKKRTALGQEIDMDSLRLNNEETIAVGNMRVNARGDELGHGGRVVKTRNQVMDEYYKLNTPTISDTPRSEIPKPPLEEDTVPAAKPTVLSTPVINTAPPDTKLNDNELRGRLASTIAKQ